MTQLTLFKLINIGLIIVNGVIFFIPKRPLSGVQSNAAGILALIALVLIVVLLAHLVLTAVAIYYNKATLLKVMGFIMVPFSLLFWYYMAPLIRF